MIPYKVYDQINLGGLSLNSWGMMVSLAFIAGLLLALQESKRKNIDREKILSLSIWLLTGAILGARLFYLALFWSYFKENLVEIFYIWQGGLVFYGGLLGSLLAGLIYLKVQKLNFWQIADLLTPSLALGIFIGRIGCFLNHYHLGRPTDLPWAINYLDGPRHETALYSSLNGLVMFIIFLPLARKIKKEGLLSLSFILWYALARFMIDQLRAIDLADSDPRFWAPGTTSGFTISQYISIVLFVMALILLIKKVKGVKRQKG